MCVASISTGMSILVLRRFGKPSAILPQKSEGPALQMKTGKIHNLLISVTRYRSQWPGTKLAEYSLKVPMNGTIFKH